AFSQFLIVYSANVAEEVPHYIARSQGGYQYITVALILLHFIVLWRGGEDRTQHGRQRLITLTPLPADPFIATIVFKPLAAVAATLAVLLTWGTWRVEQPLHGASVRAAAIRTDSRFMGWPIAPRAERAKVDDALFARTSEAARAGAKLVAWTEAATLVLPEEERELTDAAAAAARAHGIELVISYIMPLQLEPLLYENRLRWFSPDRNERLAYLKHHPVPGEPAVPGAAPAPLLHTSIGPASAAICYDFDFPELGRALARSGAGIVVVPSSDWSGIDPVHTHMAALRAIEGGCSVLRPARWGLTGGIDAHGTLVGQMTTNGGDEPFLLVTLPVAQRPTLYAALGNLVLVPLVGILLAGLFALLPVRARRERNRTTSAVTGAELQDGIPVGAVAAPSQGDA
ncbi:MAG: hypothetical protein IT180_15415, partial [Acidobacteria bacterium]|nr:hypothetical protein [Acidobacteriota bacterium]